jgi:hypothetical protein
MKRKSIIKFIIIFILSFIVMEGIERLLENIFHIDLNNLKWGWLGLMILYGFKFHIFCCLLPAIFASYKCRHKKCKHEHCETNTNK